MIKIFGYDLNIIKQVREFLKAYIEFIVNACVVCNLPLILFISKNF